MSSYELVLIVSPEVVDEEMPEFISKLSELVNKVGGSVDEVNQWGRRKLAYPIKRSTEGNYLLTKVKMKPAVTKEVEANLRLSGKILRHLLIRSGD
jgi:small subunit ribosomal protein S6